VLPGVRPFRNRTGRTPTPTSTERQARVERTQLLSTLGRVCEATRGRYCLAGDGDGTAAGADAVAERGDALIAV
jgi:hypothetical protein